MLTRCRGTGMPLQPIFQWLWQAPQIFLRNYESHLTPRLFSRLSSAVRHVASPGISVCLLRWEVQKARETPAQRRPMQTL